MGRTTGGRYEETGQEETGHAVRIGLLGHAGHGKSTLAEAIRVGRTVGMDPRPERDEGGRGGAPKGRKTRVRCETKRRVYTVVDWAGRTECAKSLITGAASLDGAILVVSAVDGPGEATREHLLLARQLGVPAVVVFLNKLDQVGDELLLDLVELEIRELLTAYGFPGDSAPVVRGSARAALEGEEGGAAALDALFDALDAHVPDPRREIDRPFLMTLQEAFGIAGRGTVVVGRIERGAVKPGDEVEIVGFEMAKRALVEGLEGPGEGLDEGRAGDRVGLLLRGVEEDQLERGQVLARPGSVVPTDRFRAEVYLLSEEEGGRGAPFPDGHRPEFYIHQTDFVGVATLPAGVKMARPGGVVQMDVQLLSPVAIGPHQRFSIREGGRTVGAGVVTALPAGPPPPGVGGFGEARGMARPSSSDEAGAEQPLAEPPRPSPTAPSRRLFADLTLFDESGARRIDDARDALCEDRDYVFEVALRGQRTGIAYDVAEPEPVAPPPSGESVRILVVLSARDTDFELPEPVQFIELPADAHADSETQARFHLRTMRRTTSPEDLAELEVRLYYELNLIEHILLVAEVRGRHDCGAGSALGLSPPVQIRQMQGVRRDYAAIARGLRPRHMSLDIRRTNDAIRFSVTIRTGEGDEAREVFLHGRRDVGTKDLTVAVNRIRDLWREVAMDRFAGVVDGQDRVFTKTLEELALQGRELWSLLFRGLQGSAMWNIGEWIRDHPPAEGAMVEVRLLDGAHSFAFPWALLYDGPDPRRRPDPDGFWGLRYAMEQKPVSRVVLPDAGTDSMVGLELAFMVWESFSNSADQAALLEGLASRSGGRLQVASPPVNDPHAFYELVEDCGADILYFYAHGHTRPVEADAAYHELERVRERFELLPEGSTQRAALKDLHDLITHPDFEPDESWIGLTGGRLYLSDLRARPVRFTRRPIVFLNMCESAQVLPGLSESFVAFFLDRQARSVIGTECPMTNQFAHPFSEYLLGELLKGEPLGEALRRARRHFVGRKNPLGLAYTLFGSGTTRYEPAVLAEPQEGPTAPAPDVRRPSTPPSGDIV